VILLSLAPPPRYKRLRLFQLAFAPPTVASRTAPPSLWCPAFPCPVLYRDYDSRGTERAEGDEQMGMGRSASGGEFDLSNPVNSFVDVVRRVVLQPVRFFAGLPRSGTLLNPLVFALVCILISAILSGLLVLVGVQQNPGFNPNPQNAIPSTFAPTSALASILFAPIGGTIGLFVAAAIQQLLVRLIVGENNSGFASTFRVASYTQVTGLVNWVPIVGPLVALYGLYLSILGIREVHGTTMGKAALVVLIPFAVVLVVALIVLAWVGFTIFNQR
jgi:hypothetical protein